MTEYIYSATENKYYENLKKKFVGYENRLLSGMTNFENKEELFDAMKEATRMELKKGFGSNRMNVFIDEIKLMEKFLEPTGNVSVNIWDEKLTFIPNQVINNGLEISAAPIIEITFTAEEKGKYYWNISKKTGQQGLRPSLMNSTNVCDDSDQTNLLDLIAWMFIVGNYN
jgi:hypothetical protein